MENNILDSVIERAREALDVAKKLTTKDRKALKSSTFCGPQKSFPIPDCQHVSTAKAFLGRSKFSAATKKKIASCINSKSKSLGCGGGKKAKASENEFPKYQELSAEQKRLYASDIFEATKKLVEDSIANPGMDLDFDLIEIED
jgi:hypothetical protein